MFGPNRSARHRRIVLGLLPYLVTSAMPVLAQQAVRDLPDSVAPSETFPVTITLTTPGGTGVVGLEDRPPTGWIVSNISDSGSFDSVSMSVKWGPFFDPSIPASVSYDVTSPSSFNGTNCFDGTASFDGNDIGIAGDSCLPAPVPAVSTWSVLALAVLIACVGTVVLRRSRTDSADTCAN